MKCNLAGLLEQAAACIDPEKDTGAYAYMLGEVADHVRDVRTGKHTLDEFADFYMVRPTEPLAIAPALSLGEVSAPGTKGPWRVSVPQEEPGGFIGVHILAGAGATRWGVAKVYTDRDAGEADRDMQAANARLIAAAPSLYEALQAFVDHYPAGINSYLDDAAIAARAALAKADGK